MATNAASHLEPYAEEWLQVEAMFGGRFVLSGSVDDIRQQFAGLWHGLASKLPPPTDAVDTNDVELPDHGPRVRIYRPKAAADAKALPIGLYIHSGGYVTGSLENEDHIARDIAQRVPMVLVSTSYRLAPEHPFPAGLDDCIASYKWACHPLSFARIWMRDNAARFSASADKAVLMGGSAGANLACAVALSVAVDAPERAPRGLVVACASTLHPSAVPDEYAGSWHPELLVDAAMLNREAMMPCLDAYGASPTEPLFSLLLNESLSKLPRTWLVACSKDPTYDEMLMFHDKLQKQGVDVSLEVCKGYPHFFWMLPMMQKSQELLAKWADQVREMVA